MPKQPKVLLFDHSPHLRGEWDYEKNIGVDPENLSCGVGTKVWWVCSHNHSWQARVYSRVRGSGCSYCSGRFAISGVNDIFTTDPELRSQWDYSKNTTDPATITRGCNKKIWWICHLGHTYSYSINTKTSQNIGCRVCNGRQILSGYNDVLTLMGDKKCEWDYDNNQGINPETIGKSYRPKVWWVCPVGHNYRCDVYSRVTAGVGCNYCSGRSTLVGVNDLNTTHPDLARELVNPEDGSIYKAGSNIKVNWVCDKGHTYTTTPNHRLSGTKCPKCMRAGISHVEEAFVRQINKNTPLNLEPATLNTASSIKKIKVDGFDPKFGVVFEYDGSYYHSDEDTVSKDIAKTNVLLCTGYTVIRVREVGKKFQLSTLPIESPNLLQLLVPYTNKGIGVEDAVNQIIEWLRDYDRLSISN